MSLAHQREAACAHCGSLPASGSCRGCGHLVCAACLSDLDRCPAPCPQRHRLPLTARALETDSGGRYVLYVSWFGTCRVFDLRRGGPALAPAFGSVARKRLARGDFRPRAVVLPTGAVVSIDAVPTPEGPFVSGVIVRPSRGPDHHLRSAKQACSELAGTVACEDGALVLCCHETATQTVLDIVSPAGPKILATWDFPFRARTLAACASSRLLALAEERAVHFYDLDFESGPPLGGPLELGSPLELQGPPLWVGLAPNLLVTLTPKAGLGLYRWREGRLPSRWAGVEVGGGHLGDGVAGPMHASLGADGAYLALRGWHSVRVVRLADQADQLLSIEHQGEVDLVRLVDRGRRLIVGCRNGELWEWYRRGGSFVAAGG